jgi:site-specific recombinase XerC
MTTTNTFGIVFYLKRQKQKKGKAPIYARITVDGQRVEISIKKDIDVDNWSKGKGMASVPIETVSKLLGHTSINTTQIYAKVIEQ